MYSKGQMLNVKSDISPGHDYNTVQGTPTKKSLAHSTAQMATHDVHA